MDKSACEGDIRFDSKIYLDMLFTLHKGLIYRKLGFVKDKTIIEEINKKLRILFFDELKNSHNKCEARSAERAVHYFECWEEVWVYL